jgi:plasmid segregation protein ParM
MRTVVALDIGHSAVKAVAYSTHGRRETIFPTFVTPAVAISGDPAEAARCQRETVEVGGAHYFFGDTAAAQGRMRNVVGLNADWIETAEYRVLMRAAMQRLAEGLVPDLASALIVVGLPADTFAARKDRLKTIVAELFPDTEAIALQQPAGALWAHLLDADGTPTASRRLSAQRWGVVEVGHFTSDFLLMEKGRFIQAANGSCQGVSRAVDYLVSWLEETGVHVTHEIAMQAMQDNFLKIRGERRDVSEKVAEACGLLAQQVIDEARSRHGKDVDFLDGVIVAGGGAPLVLDRLHALGWTHAVFPDAPQGNPRFAVAEGFARYGLSMLQLRQQQAKKRA